MKNPKKVAAALARKESLSPEDRSAIARRAALTRYGKNIPSAIAEGTLIIGGVHIPCAVLNDSDNTRVLTQEGFLTAIGRAGKAKGGEGASIDGKPAFLRAKNLEPFISTDLIESTSPIEFIPYKGPGYQGRAFGYKAKLLPAVCWVYQDAYAAQKLLPSQSHIADASRALLKAFTDYAIEDLVDRATGFDDIRKREAIDRILERYVEPSALPWVKLFDLDFYRQIYRLNGWPFDPQKTAKPGVVGRWTNDIYERLAPGVKDELHRRVRRNDKGRPTQKLTQYLTSEEGKPQLIRMLEGVKALMRISRSWDEFMVHLNIAYPKFGDTLQLPLGNGVSYLPENT